MSAPQRISIVGPCGSGKTTLSKQLAEALHLERLELDSLQHQPNWVELEPALFRRRVADFVQKPRWVIDGNYTSIGALDLIWERADRVVWLDLPQQITLRRLLWRSVRRAITREPLWNGNREPFCPLFSPNPDKNFVLWAWRHRAGHPRRARHLDPRLPAGVRRP